MTTANPYSIVDHLANGTVACEGAGPRCERIVRVPEHVAAALAEDYSNCPYCPACRVDAAGDATLDDPMQGPERPRRIEVVEIETGNVVHTIDVSGKSEAHIDRVIGGMLINMDTDRFCVGEAPA